MDKETESMNNTPLFKFLKSWYVFIPAVVLLVFGLIFSMVVEMFGFIYIIISIGITLGLSFIAFYIVNLFSKGVSQIQLSGDSEQSAEREFVKFIDQYWVGKKPGIPGIIKDEDLAKHEANIENCDEIWLISYDLCTEWSKDLYHDVVINNLKRGIKYVYFVADTPGIEEKIKREIKTVLPDTCKENIQYRLLKNDFFFLVDKVDFVIYNPYRSVVSGRKAYMSLYVPGDCTYEAQMNNDLVDILISKLKRIWEDGL